jgi:serine/threonine-protein kinase RsbW
MVQATQTLILAADLAELAQLEKPIRALVAQANIPSDPEMFAYGLQLAVHEACTNIVLHAYDDQQTGTIRIEMTLRADPARIQIDLWDEGRAFNPTAVAAPEPGTIQEHGFGIFLLHELLDDVVYERSNNHNHWKLVKLIP